LAGTKRKFTADGLARTSAGTKKASDRKMEPLGFELFAIRISADVPVYLLHNSSAAIREIRGSLPSTNFRVFRLFRGSSRNARLGGTRLMTTVARSTLTIIPKQRREEC
jgi:hypothetical protein